MNVGHLKPVAPQRQWVLPGEVDLNVVEWGPADGPPLALVHGGGDFARSYDAFAPLLAAAGWRVCAWDQRGHGDSGRASLYGYVADLRDGARMIEALGGGRPIPLVGHSKGAVLSIELAVGVAHLVGAVVAIDGFTRRRAWTEPTPVVAGRWLDGRRKARAFRPGSADDLAARRAAQNPRLDPAWARYLVGVGAGEVEGGWRWKLDPAAFPPPPHPWPPDYSFRVLSQITCPFLGLKATEEEAFSAQPDAARLAGALPPHARFEVLEGLGHFAHIEEPERLAALVLSFLGALTWG